jgi:hypothetical protein
MRIRRPPIAAISLLLIFVASPAFARDKPNIVLVFMDNFGYGELGIKLLDHLVVAGLGFTSLKEESPALFKTSSS